MLVAAIDDGSLANDPMGALMQIGDADPAEPRGVLDRRRCPADHLRADQQHRGRHDRARQRLRDRRARRQPHGPADRGHRAGQRRAGAEGAFQLRGGQILSVQAQLTDNSYLFSRDCQLTGGFAFFMWYPAGAVRADAGRLQPGLHSLPRSSPTVPRLGFNWSVGDRRRRSRAAPTSR